MHTEVNSSPSIMKIVSYPFKVVGNRGGADSHQLIKSVCDVKLQYNLILTWGQKPAEIQLKGATDMGHIQNEKEYASQHSYTCS